jgi:hypothetical protein
MKALLSVSPELVPDYSLALVFMQFRRPVVILGIYRDLAEREAKIGRLVDANIVGIVI